MMKPLALFIIWALAIGIALHPRGRRYAFASWVCAAVGSALIYPSLLLAPLPVAYGTAVTILLQIAMFGMGATLTAADFIRISKMPWGVLIGVVLQYSVMPLVGWSVAKGFRLPPDLAAGFVLLGACPGGISSNVVTYLARGNVALSVTMTACSTLLAPLMTPLMFYCLAGETVEVDYVAMFLQILQTVAVPIGLGLVFNAIVRWSGGSAVKWERRLAGISMIAICLICGLIAAKSQQRLLQVGWLLLFTVALHNSIGFTLGYWGARLFRLSPRDSRTVAIEVGMQNGGMAANLATEVLKKEAAALAPALFAAVMNVHGSILASIWSSRALRKGDQESTTRSADH